MNANFDSIIRSTAKMSAVPEDSTYNITAEVHIEGPTVTKMTDGRVMLANAEVAVFNVWDGGKLRVAFNIADKAARMNVLSEIEAFVEAVVAKVNIEPITV